MTEHDLTEIRDDLLEQFENNDVEADGDDILDRLETLVGEYQVPVNEAKRSVVNHYSPDSGMSAPAGEPEDMDIGAVSASDQRVSVEGTITQLWEDTHETIAQSGRIGDETGTKGFTIWVDSDMPTVEEDKVYRFDNFETNEYNGQVSVQTTPESTITELSEKIEAKGNTETCQAALVDIKTGSGLIKRCPEDDCTFVIQNGRCQDHGEVDGEFDLRIKAVFDDGNEPQDVLFNREQTEAVTDITIEDAKTLAKQKLDTTVVASNMVKELVGRYYEVEGPMIGRYLLVNDFTELDGPTPDDVSEQQARVRGLMTEN